MLSSRWAAVAAALLLSISMVGASEPQRTSAASNSDAQTRAEEDWSQVAKWLHAAGGQVHPSLKGGVMDHGGVRARGIMTKEKVGKQQVLLRVPRKLWIVKENFPEMWGALPEACNSGDIDDIEFRNSAALAVQISLGDQSKWYPWLKSLPKVDEIAKYHPSFMGELLREEFSALPVAKFAEQEQKRRRSAKVCFEAWRNVPDSPVRRLAWQTMVEALALFTTRHLKFSENSGKAIIPGTDMINAVPEANGANTDWRAPVEMEKFFTVRAKGAIKTGTEILESYCPQCTNTNALCDMGVYIEDLPETVSAIDVSLDSSVNCNANVSSSRGTSLQEVSEAVLDLVPGWHKAGWKAPRCRGGGFNSAFQSPMRCSLARLAWEYCATFWAWENQNANAKSQKETSVLQTDIDAGGKMMRRHNEHRLVLHPSDGSSAH